MVIQPAGGHDVTLPDEVPNGLVAATLDAIVIRTGIHTGTVEVEVRLSLSPPSKSVERGDEAEDLEFVTSVGDMELWGFMEAEPNGLPVLTPQGPGRYGMRVQARGRDTDPDAVPSTPFEYYEITVWPIELGSTVIPQETVAASLPDDPRRAALREWMRGEGSPHAERGRIARSQ